MINKEAILKDRSSLLETVAARYATGAINTYKELELSDLVFELVRDAYKSGYILKMEEEEAALAVRPEVRQRFFAKVDRSGDCWLWKGATNKNGYGFFRYKGKSEYVHRVSYLIHHDVAIPDDVFIAQSCKNRLCVRPEHLETRPKSEHARRAVNARYKKKEGDHEARRDGVPGGEGQAPPASDPGVEKEKSPGTS